MFTVCDIDKKLTKELEDYDDIKTLRSTKKVSLCKKSTQ